MTRFEWRLSGLAFVVCLVSLIGILSMVPWEPLPASCRLWSETPRFGQYTDVINGELYICSDI